MNESTDNSAESRSRGRASNLKQRLQQDGKQKIESGKRAAADQIADIADAIDVAGSQLDQSQPTLANYAAKIANGVGGLATHLREDSIEDIYREVRQLATRHPGMFLLGSAALGVVVARFMKASGEDRDAGAESDEAPDDEHRDEQRWAEGESENRSFYGQSAAAPDPYGSPTPGA